MRRALPRQVGLTKEEPRRFVEVNGNVEEQPGVVFSWYPACLQSRRRH